MPSLIFIQVAQRYANFCEYLPFDIIIISKWYQNSKLNAHLPACNGGRACDIVYSLIE